MGTGDTPQARSRKEPFDDPDWLFDFKYDGFRALCYLEQRRNRLISPNNNIMTRFDAFADQVAAALNIDDAILDGEIIAADETGRPVFIDLLRGTRSPCYAALSRRTPKAAVCGAQVINTGRGIWPASDATPAC